MIRLVMSGLLVTMMTLATGCVVEHDRGHDRGYNEGYREGYYDRERHRWWHENAWRDCIEHDEHCPD
jgi:hypothetical protein